MKVNNTIASEQLFRVGIANDLITFAGDVVLIVALYVLTPNDSKAQRDRTSSETDRISEWSKTQTQLQ